MVLPKIQEKSELPRDNPAIMNNNSKRRWESKAEIRLVVATPWSLIFILEFLIEPWGQGSCFYLLPNCLMMACLGQPGMDASGLLLSKATEGGGEMESQILPSTGDTRRNGPGFTFCSQFVPRFLYASLAPSERKRSLGATSWELPRVRGGKGKNLRLVRLREAESGKE